jgi:hypothetical protein
VLLHGGGIAVYLRRAARHQGGAPGGTVGPVPRREKAEERTREAVPERITIPELRRLWEQGEPVTVLDVRTERSYRDDPQIAKDAIRMPPDDAVRLARERGLDQHGTVVLYCT